MPVAVLIVGYFFGTEAPDRKKFPGRNSVRGNDRAATKDDSG